MLREGLLFWNPWWAEKRYRIENVKDRSSSKDVRLLFGRKEVLALTGVRRSGKTSMMNLMIRDLLSSVDPKQIMYVNLEDPTFEQSTLEEIYQIYKELMLPDDGQFLFLDEVQSKFGWEKWVKKMYDSRLNVKMTVTGSNSSLLKAEFSSYLAGRNLTFKVFPLSFLEFLSFIDSAPKSMVELLADRARINHHLLTFMKYGGFPEVVLEENEKLKVTLLKEYYSAILTRDVLARYEIKERSKLERLAAYLITNSSCEVSAKSLSRIVELNIRTVQEYMEHLQSVYLFFFVNHFSYSLKAQYTYPRKVYCVDVGMKNAVGFSFSENDGRTMENLVYLKLMQKGEVYYWRDRDADIDFVLKQGKDVIGLFQSCHDMSDPKTMKREIKGLLRAMDHFKLEESIVINRDREDTISIDGKRILLVPLWKWLLEDVLIG